MNLDEVNIISNLDEVITLPGKLKFSGLQLNRQLGLIPSRFQSAGPERCSLLVAHGLLRIPLARSTLHGEARARPARETRRRRVSDAENGPLRWRGPSTSGLARKGPIGRPLRLRHARAGRRNVATQKTKTMPHRRRRPPRSDWRGSPRRTHASVAGRTLVGNAGHRRWLSSSVVTVVSVTVRERSASGGRLGLGQSLRAEGSRSCKSPIHHDNN